MARLLDEIRKDMEQLSDMKRKITDFRQEFEETIYNEEQKNKRRYEQASNMDEKLSSILEEDHVLNMEMARTADELLSECNDEINSQFEKLEMEY